MEIVIFKLCFKIYKWAKYYWRGWMELVDIRDFVKLEII